MGSNPTPRTKDEPTAQSIFQVLWQMKKDGYSENTIKPIGRRLRNLAKHADLDLPEKVKEFIARAKWSNGYKENMANAYNHYAAFHGLKWRKPRYQRASSIKKLPLESDIDLIIGHTKIRNEVAFRLIKECGLRPIEVSRLTPKQIDLNKGLVYPETAKGGEARVLKLKQETLTLLRKLIINCQRRARAQEELSLEVRKAKLLEEEASLRETLRVILRSGAYLKDYAKELLLGDYKQISNLKNRVGIFSQVKPRELNVILRILKRREDLVGELLEIEDKLLPSEAYPFMVTEQGWKVGDFQFARDRSRPTNQTGQSRKRLGGEKQE